MGRGNYTIKIPGLEKLGFLVANKQDLKDKVNELQRDLINLRDLRTKKQQIIEELIAEIEMIEQEEMKAK